MEIGSRVEVIKIDGSCDPGIAKRVIGKTGTIIAYDKDDGPEHEQLPVVHFDSSEKEAFFWESELKEIDADGNDTKFS